MPITQSVKKALRQNIKRRGINRKRKTAMKAVIKDFKKLATANQTEKAKAALPKTYKIIDKMVIKIIPLTLSLILPQLQDIGKRFRLDLRIVREFNYAVKILYRNARLN